MENKKIALCFLTYNNLSQPKLWEHFIHPKYNIYIHYKNDVKLKYFDDYKINETVSTKYADISIVKAQNHMLQEALKDINNTHFIFL